MRGWAVLFVVGQYPERAPCLISLVEKVHGASPKEDHPDPGSHWVLASFLAFWTTGDSLFPGRFLLMALV